MKIYIDSDFKCHINNQDNAFSEVEHEFFNGKCDTFIEGYRFIPFGETWSREDGIVFTGEMIAPWKDYSELDNAQREYERRLLFEYKSELAELDAQFLELQYQNLMEGL